MPMRQTALLNLILLLLLFILPAWAQAGFSSNSCHCFRNRSYDPEDRFAADDYLVATTFNSLIAKSFHISKKKIVLLKMQGGVDPDDLLIALYLARKSGRDPDLLLDVRNNGGSWRQIMHASGLAGRQSDPVLRALARGDSGRQVAALITDSMIMDAFGIDKNVIEQLRVTGFNGRQITVICALAGHANRTPGAIAAMYRQQKMSWAEIAARFNLTPKEVGKIIA
ncbi:MAG TPA: hypothetical protein ENI89_02500 [Desulfobulbus sp.]|nr:hypothetical protein [Desulfobulbus sp.]